MSADDGFDSLPEWAKDAREHGPASDPWAELAAWDRVMFGEELDGDAISPLAHYARIFRESMLYGNVYFDENGDVIKDGWAKANPALANGLRPDAVFADEPIRQAAREPTMHEIKDVLDGVRGMLILKSDHGPGRCGALPPGQVSGAPMPCDRLSGHTPRIKHKNFETGYTWWS